MTEDNIRPIVVDGVTVGDVLSNGDKFVVRGLRQMFGSPDEAAQALLARRTHTIEVAEKHKPQSKNVKVKIGNTLFNALIDRDLWIGRPVEETKTQTTVEVEDTEVLRASLTELIAGLEASAKQATRTEGASMKSRALIGAARQQMAKL